MHPVGGVRSGLHALIHAILLLRRRGAEGPLVVAAEASVHPLFVGSFKRLGVLSPEGFGCRPFDVDQRGFFISGAAAAVCLESAVADNADPTARIERFPLCADATHLTGGDPNGRVLRHLLSQVINNRPVDLIHAHATGTTFNDPIELAAIDSAIIADGSIPAIYSHKGASSATVWVRRGLWPSSSTVCLIRNQSCREILKLAGLSAREMFISISTLFIGPFVAASQSPQVLAGRWRVFRLLGRALMASLINSMGSSMEDDNALSRPVRIEYFSADNVFRLAEIRLRFLAFVIDGFVSFGIFIVAVLITDAIMPKVNYFQNQDQLHRTSDIIEFIWLIANWLYFAGMESSPCQATLGKLVAGLKSCR